MSTSKSLTPQVKDLLLGLSEHSSQHLSEVETDLIQTNILLGEAIEKLNKNFMAIHRSITAQQEMLETILAQNSVSPDVCAALRGQAKEIGMHVNGAITGLQFQDMTSQLIGRIQRRIAGLRDMLSVSGIEELEKSTDDESTRAALEKINSVLASKSTVLEKELWKTVCQTHMESGDIELF
tara:strand:+ start:69909 stop:70451 length:543 start_codon:yes stop_codon:yes gene_type:complete